jgi:hypothetical protein
MNESNPVFIKIDKYKEITDIIKVIEKKISDAKSLMSQIDDIKSKEDDELMHWEKSIDELTSRLEHLKERLS